MKGKQAYKLKRGSYLRRFGGEKELIRAGQVFYPIESEIAMLGNDIVAVPNPTRRVVKRAPAEEPVEPKTSEGGGEDQDEQGDESDDEDQDEQDEDIVHIGGGYYELPTGERVKGKEAALEALKSEE